MKTILVGVMMLVGCGGEADMEPTLSRRDDGSPPPVDCCDESTWGPEPPECPDVVCPELE